MQKQKTVLFVLLTCLLAVAGQSLAATLYVSPGGSQTPPYDTLAKAATDIQTAVSAAANFDTVLVDDGTYTLSSEISITKFITVRGINGYGSVIVDGNNSVRCFNINYPDAVLEDFTVRNGKASNANGGGILNNGGIISNCVIESCSAYYGGGIRCQQGKVLHCIVRNSSADYGGGGIQITDDGWIQNSRIYGNSSLGYGGGVNMLNGGTVKGVKIYSNTSFWGGGVRLENGGTVDSCTIYDNTADGGDGGGGGGAVQIKTDGTVVNSIIYDNETTGRGGGVAIYDGGTIQNCTITENSSDYWGGGIFIDSKGTVNNTISYLNAATYGVNYYNNGSGSAYSYCNSSPAPSGTGNINANPQFVDAASHDYHVATNSSCIDIGPTGTPSGYPTLDFDGEVRPQDGLGSGTDAEYDCGAYEFEDLLFDTDGDGMPDLWELQYGLDPNDPADGPLDSFPWDQDGLVNSNEYNYGSDPTNGDTDGDTLIDGGTQYTDGEVHDYGTSPATNDTDGDAYNDNVELDAGTDPLNPLSFPVDLSGTVTYGGTQTGDMIVYASTNSMGTNLNSGEVPLGAYTISGLAAGTGKDYFIWGFRDSNTNSNRDTWEAWGELVGNPLSITGEMSGVDFTFTDPTNDTDGDGLSDFFEVYTSLTDPEDEDSDGDVMDDGWEWGYYPTLNPNVHDGVSDPDNDGLNNLAEYNVWNTDPTNPDSDGDGMPDGWEAQYSSILDPLDPTDGALDYDSDDLVNSNEYLFTTNDLHRTDPTNPDSDGDNMPDGWEVQYYTNLNPRVGDATNDFDNDGLSNISEYNFLTDPTNPDTDGDSMNDGWEINYIPDLSPLTNDAAADPDGDTLNNLLEYVAWPPFNNQTHPNQSDSDGDGFDDNVEKDAGTDPMDPNSFPMAISGTLTYTGIQTSGLFIVTAGFETNSSEYQGTADTNTLDYQVADVVPSNYYVSAYRDVNANSTNDSWEPYGYYTNEYPLTVTVSEVGIDFELFDPTTDTDGDGLSDFFEVYTSYTDPYTNDTDGDLMDDGWEWQYQPTLNPLTNDAAADPDADGLVNLSEYTNVFNAVPQSTNPTNDDTDADGLLDGDEVHIHFTDPNNADSDGDGLNDDYELAANPHVTDPVDDDSDDDGATDGEEDSAGTDPNDPTSFPASFDGTITYTGSQTGEVYVTAADSAGTNISTVAAATNTPTTWIYSISNLVSMSNYNMSAYMDTSGNMTTEVWEAFGVYSNNPIALTVSVITVDFEIADSTNDTDGDGLSDMFEHYTSNTDPTTNDTDGDSMWDGWEWNYRPELDPTDPSDGADDDDVPIPDGLVNSNEFAAGTDPTNPDTDGDGMDDGWESRYVPTLNPLTNDAAADPDGDSLSNILEYTGWASYWVQTDPTVADSDGDNFNDNVEKDAGTDPMNSNSFPATISGVIDYAGIQTGVVYAIISDASTSNVVTAVSNAPGSWTYTKDLPSLVNYDVMAYMDSTGNASQDTWEAWGFYTNNPVFLDADKTNINVTLANPTNDTDSDGLTDFFEVYTSLTSPTNSDTDADSMPDGWEYTNMPPLDPNVFDPDDDTDADNLSASNEYALGTSPLNPDSDGDSMPDGWEADYPLILDPTDPSDGADDDEIPTPDGLVNSNEFFYDTDPTVWDTDGDSMPDGWEVDYIAVLHPTNETDGANDPDVDTLVNSNEYIYGTDPTDPDSDGDTVSDGYEVGVGTDPTDSNSFPVVVSGTLTYAGAFTQETYVVFNLADGSNPFATNLVAETWPTSPYMHSNLHSISSYWVMAYIDIDSNGVFDSWEPSGNYTNNPLIPVTAITNGIDITIADSTANSDADSLSDFFEYNVSGTSPTNEDTDGDSMWDDWEWSYQPTLDPNTPDGDGDPDGDGLTNAAEYVFLTNPTTNDTDGDLMDDFWESGYVPVLSPTIADATNDPDGDALTNLLEYTGWAPYWVQTDPTTNDTDGDFSLDNEEMLYRTDPTNELSFPADISGVITNTATSAVPGIVYAVVSGGLTNMTVAAVTNGFTNSWNYSFTNQPTLSNYTVIAYMDSTVNATQDGWEISGEYPANPFQLNDDMTNIDITMTIPTNDTDGDTLLDYDEVYTYSTDPNTNDTDGDLMDDAWEVLYMPYLDPNVDDATGDLDSDGLNNTGEYFYAYGGVTNSTIPSTNDTDGDLLIDGDEVTAGTDAHNPDTDSDGVEDGVEVNTYGTSPTTNDTDGDLFTDSEEIITLESDALSTNDPIVVDGNWWGTEVGSRAEPFNTIQEGIDAAVDGSNVVVVMEGTYFGAGNRNIDPQGKAIIIRSFTGWTNTMLLGNQGEGFVCHTAETTNTVIRGFTIQTSVKDHGDAGVRCGNASPQILDCYFFDCGEAGVSVTNGGAPLISQCLFESNDVGIAIADSSPTVDSCTIRANLGDLGGGVKITGTSSPQLDNCLIIGNQSTDLGGGVYIEGSADPTFRCTTIAGNSATNAGGGVWSSSDDNPVFVNTIIYENVAPTGANYEAADSMDITYSCLLPSYTGGGNITNDPNFVGGGDYQLSAGSPCIDSGGGSFPLTDLLGVLRPQDGDGNPSFIVDRGCYEYVPGGGGGGYTSDGDGDTLPDEWEDAYGISSDSPFGDDGAGGDPDGDGFDNYSEFIAGTDPGDPDSSLGILSLALDGVAEFGLDDRTIEWSSVPGHEYHVEAVGNLAEPWVNISGVITALTTTTSFTDDSDENPRFYRIYVYP